MNSNPLDVEYDVNWDDQDGSFFETEVAEVAYYNLQNEYYYYDEEDYTVDAEEEVKAAIEQERAYEEVEYLDEQKEAENQYNQYWAEKNYQV